MTPWLALQVEWVRFAITDNEFIDGAERIGKGALARECVHLYHTKYEGKRQ